MTLNKFIVAIMIALAASMISIFMGFPWRGTFKHLKSFGSLEEARENRPGFHMKPYVLYLKKQNLMDNLEDFHPRTHEAKTKLRLVMPVLMKLFDLNFLQLYYVQVLFGFLLIFIIALLAIEITFNYFHSFLITLAVACTYFVRACYMDIAIWGDTFSYFFIMAAILLRKHKLLLAVLIFIIPFNDERAILSIPIILLAVKVMDSSRLNELSWNRLLSVNDNSKYIYIALFISLTLRFFLAFKHNLSIESDLLSEFKDSIASHWKQILTGFVSGLGGLWIWLLIAVLISLKYKYTLFYMLSGVIILYSSIVSMGVADITKSIAYLAPLSVLSLKIIYKELKEPEYMVYACVIMNLLLPTYYVVGKETFYTYPLLLELYFLGWF